MADESHKANLSQLSRVMAWLSAAGATILPLLVATTILYPPLGYALGSKYQGIDALTIAQTPFGFRAIAFLCALGPTGFTVWALLSLRRLFLLYAHGEVFSHQALRMLNHVAVALFASVIVGFVMQAPITLLLSWHLGAGHRAVSLGLGTDDVVALFMAGAVLVIARVMAEARRMADENAGFV